MGEQSLNTAGPDSTAKAVDSCEFALDASLEISDVTEVRRRLLDALVGIRRMTLDVRALTSVDTAGVQLLLMLAREAKRRGIEFSCWGESQPLSLALRCLGLAATVEDLAR